MTDQLLVFVSSMMGELTHARLAAERAVNSIELSRSWLFEHTPAMSGPLSETYLRDVRRCDMLILLLCYEVSAPVVSEVETAIAANKPVLTFLFEDPDAKLRRQANPTLQGLLNKVGPHTKHIKWHNLLELESEVGAAVRHELVQGYQQYRLTEDEQRRLRAPFQAPPPPAEFVGREIELVKLRWRLLGGQAGGAVGVHGMAGIGKTALAAKLAHDLRGEFRDGVVWCQVGERDPLTILSELAHAYGVEVLPQSGLEERAASVRSLLGDKRAMLVLDDVRQFNVKYLPHLLPPPQCVCVVTSRLEGLPGVTTEELGALSEKEGLDLLRRIVGAGRLDAELEAGREIHHLTGGLPLALEIAASRLAQRQTWTLASFAQRLLRARLAELQRGEGKELDLAASFRSSYDELDDEARRRFRALGVFAADFSVASAACLWGLMPHDSLTADSPKPQWNGAECAADGPSSERPARAPLPQLDAAYRDAQFGLEGLCRLSLLESVSVDRYRLHDLLRVFAMDALSAAAEETLARWHQVEYYLSYVECFPHDYDRLESEWLNLEDVLEWLDDHRTASSSSLQADCARALLRLVELIGRPHVTLMGVRGYWREGIRWGNAAVEAAHALGDRHAEARYAASVGAFYHLLGDLSQARLRHQAALDGYRALSDERCASTCLHELGRLSQDEGQHEQARRLYREAMELERKCGDVANMSRTAAQLASLSALQGRYADARSVYKECAETFEKLGAVRELATTLHCLGRLGQYQGRFEEARQLYEQTLALERGLGDPLLTATTLLQLGGLAREQGRCDQARRLCEESLALERAVGHTAGIGACLQELGNTSYLQGRFSEARQLYEDCLVLARKVNDPHLSAVVGYQLGMLAQTEGKHEEAHRLYEEASMTFDRLGLAPERFGVLLQLGSLAQAAGQYAEAHGLYEQSLTLAKTLGDTAGIASALHQLGNVSYFQRRPADAQRYYEESLRLRRRQRDLVGIAGSLHQLGVLARERGGYDEARKLHGESLALERSSGHAAGIAASLYQLGLVAESTGADVEAKELYDQSLEVAAHLGLPQVAMVREALDRVSQRLGH